MRIRRTLAVSALAAALAVGAAAPALADGDGPGPDPSTSASAGPSDSVSPSPSTGDRSGSPSPGTSSSPSTEPGPELSIEGAFSPNPVTPGARLALTVTVRNTSSGGTMTIDGVGGPLSVRYVPEEYACGMTSRSRITCSVPTDEDAATYVATIVVREPSRVPVTKWVTLTAQTDAGTVSTKVPVRIVSSTTSPSSSPSTSPSGSAGPSAPASATPSTPSGAGSLPVTGTSLLLVGGIAAVLLGGGTAIVLVTRRRRLG